VIQTNPVEMSVVSKVNMAHGDYCESLNDKFCYIIGRQNTWRNKQILNVTSASIKEIIFVMKADHYTEEAKQREKMTVELSLFMMRSLIYRFRPA